MNKKYRNYIIFIVIAIGILIIASMVIMNSLKEESKKSMNNNQNTSIQNYMSKNNIPSNAVIEGNVAKVDNNTYIEIEEPWNEETNDISEVEESTADYQYATYFVTKYLEYLVEGNEQAILALNPTARTGISITNGSSVQIKHILAGGYSYNKTYYIQISVNDKAYYLVAFFDMNNKSFQVIETDITEYENAVNNKMKDEYNKQYNIGKTQYNSYEDFSIRT